jgi:hypothetical protein
MVLIVTTPFEFLLPVGYPVLFPVHALLPFAAHSPDREGDHRKPSLEPRTKLFNPGQNPITVPFPIVPRQRGMYRHICAYAHMLLPHAATVLRTDPDGGR